MGGIYPLQERAIDPFSSYNSNTFNAFTRVVTGGENAVSSNNAINVINDTTSPDSAVVILPGTCFKDDVMITITDNFRVDFTDIAFYDSTSAFDEDGYYYLLLDYSYAKSLPAPQAAIHILKPSQRMSYTQSQYLLLKIVEVTFNGFTYAIEDFFEFDPEIPTNKVIYTSTFASLVNSLPAFDFNADRGKLIYDLTKDLAYLGTIDGWRSIANFDYPCDAHLCLVGQPAYLDPSKVAQPAIAAATSTFAIGIVVRNGSNGLIRLNGQVDNIIVEGGVTFSINDEIYLSRTVPGSVTNALIAGEYNQLVGKCLAVDGTTITTVLCSLSQSITSHNRLSGLQGGDATNQYHLTVSDYNHVVSQDFTHNNLSGIQGGDSTDRYHLDSTNYNHVINQNFNHANLSGVQGGDSTSHYHLTLNQFTNIVGATVPVGTILAFFPGYFYFVGPPYLMPDRMVYGMALISSNTIAGVNAYLQSIGGNFAVCDGTAPNDPGSPIWNSATRCLPYLVDGRFLEGTSSITMGGGAAFGGVTYTSHTHDVTVAGHTLSLQEIPAHTHSIDRATLNVSLGSHNIGWVDTPNSYGPINTSSAGGGGSHGHPGSITSSQSSGTDNRPQFMQCFYIIRIK